MEKGLKIAVIGGGSTYTPELIDGFMNYREHVPIDTLVLMDLYDWRLNIVGGLARRMLERHGHPARLVLTTSRGEALEGADFVIAQIRVGGMTARLADEIIPPRYNVIGQETVGPGGFAKALRTVPVMLEIAHDMARLAPHAQLINFTNPSGLITEAIRRHSDVQAIGLCNLPTNMRIEIASLLSVTPGSVTLDYVGLNHLGWVRGVWVNGENRIKQVLQLMIEQAAQEENPVFLPELLETLGIIPSYYLTFYYHHDRMLATQRQAPQTRAERAKEIEEELLRLYADPALADKPNLLAERGGAYYSTAAVSLMAAMVGDTGTTHILNVPNQSTFSYLPPDVVIETPCRVDADGAHVLPAEPLPLPVRGLIEAVSASLTLTIQAAVTGDRRIALQALLAHPLVPSFDAARSLLAALLAEHRDYLPQFVPNLTPTGEEA
jgi:6-phospho-beta-glucosidase